MIAEQYAFFPALNATLNGTSAVLLLTGRVFIAKGKVAAHRTCMIAAVVASALFLCCYLFFHFKVGNILFLGQGWARPVYFDDSDFARDAGHRDRSPRYHHVESWTSRPLRKTSRHRPLDMAALDVCFRHGSDCVFHALSVVSAQLKDSFLGDSKDLCQS